MAQRSGATSRSYGDLSTHERVIVQHALNVYKRTLQRSLQKEVAGSEIFTLREREIAAVNAVAVKFSDGSLV